MVLKTWMMLIMLCARVHGIRKVGITLNKKWNSTTYAVVHHVYFLYDTIDKSVHWEPYLLMEDYQPSPLHIYGHSYRTARIWDLEQYDVVIEASGTYPTNHVKEKYPHIKNVYFIQGPTYFESLERIIENKEMAAKISRRVDAVWLTPQYDYQATYSGEWMRQDKTAITPYLWSPRRLPKVHHYQKGTSARVGVYETNRGVYKMSMVPLFIANRAHRRQQNAISYLEACALKHIWGDVLLDIGKDLEIDVQLVKELVNIPQRYEEKKIGTVLSHHMLNGLNYLHMEALYMNMSLVHNSEYIKDCGYFYNDFDIEEGSEVLLHAIQNHDNNLEAYAKRSAKCLWRYSPENPVNVRHYESLLESLF